MMRQTIHIFAKDVRRWRWPVAVLMALFVARTIMLPRDSAVHSPEWDLSRTIKLFQLLLTVVWWLLPALAIHDESLAGDRQFWLTRPYSWRSLLAAKALFVLAFVLTPLLISDAVVLAMGDFSPWALLPGLLWFDFLKLMILLPAALLASVTGGMRQFLMASLLVVVVIVGGMTLAPSLGEAPSFWYLAMYIAVPAGLLLWQYGQRRTMRVWWSIAACVVLSMIPAVWPNGEIAEIGATSQPGLSIRFASERKPLDFRNSYPMLDRVMVDLPVEVVGRDRDLWNASLADLRIEADGEVWHPRWEGRNRVGNRGGSDWLEIALSSSDFRRLSSGDAKVRADIALRIYEDESSTTLPRNGPWQRVEGVGYAQFGAGSGMLMMRRMALYESTKKLIFTMPLDVPGGRVRGESVGEYPRDFSRLHLSPLITYAGFFDWPGIPTRTTTVRLRPGEPSPTPPQPDLALRVLRPIGLVKRTLTIEGVRLADWVVQR